MWWLLALHLFGIVVAALVGRRAIRSGLAVAAIPGAVTTAWTISLLADGPDAPTRRAELVWVEGLDLILRFETRPLALLATLLVAGIGSLVFVYAIGYFEADAPGGARFPATLLAFATSMLGLVWAANVWTLFIFWEFTSITSFLLVGHKHAKAEVRLAARRALLITGGGGLALLCGLLILAESAGTTDLAALAGAAGIDPGATSTTVAAILVLLGAATKSAQVPFHVWLPGAMAAPTPVSAYLHSATMVKAGILLVALLSPTFSGVGAWKTVGLTFGIASMLWGAIGALRQRDAKLILAWGTVSQLGLLVTLLAVGTAKATFAAIALLFAHALFKAALFLVVGEIDIRTGTRDIAELRGLARSMPITFAVALAAGASMAGAPPLLGFAAKEAAVEAVLQLEGLDAVIVAGSVILGAALTVAYTLRFLLCTFGSAGSAGDAAPTTIAPRRAAMTAPAVILGVAGLLGFAVLGTVTDLVVRAASQLDPSAAEYQLYRFHGVTPALLATIGAFVVGGTLGVVAAGMRPAAPRPLGAATADRAVDGFLGATPRLISIVQHGSLPVSLLTMVVVASAATVPLWTEVSLSHLDLAASPVQAVLAVVTAAAAVAMATVRTRLDAALALGAVGIGVTGLFVVQGAPDLALTQLLVETVIVVGFVAGLARLAPRFPPVDATWRTIRIVVSLVAGIGVAGALAAAGTAPTGRAPVGRIASEAYESGGGANVVNVILTDLRALDTVGEVVVLAVVALGVLALARVPRSPSATSSSSPTPAVSSAAALGVTLATPPALVVGLYLLVAGHNRPGGGFAAGLVLGAVVALRALTGNSFPPARPLLALGTLGVAGVAILPVLWGDTLADQALATVELPLFGKVKAGTALPFDIGVTLVVVGLVAALLEALGDEMDDLERLAVGSEVRS